MSSFHRVHFDQVDSTNVEATRMIHDGRGRHGTLITAELQTQGRGQFGRTWHSVHAQNAMLSLIIEPQNFLISDQYLLNHMASLAVADVVTEYGLDPSVKWPNDIYVSDKKICGILIQNFLQGEHIQFSIIGVGCNTNQISWPPEIPNPTSLAVELGKSIHVNEVIESLATSIMRKSMMLIEGREQLTNEYHRRLYKKDEVVTFKSGDDLWAGVIVGVDNSGQLLVRKDSEILSFQHGDISMIIT